MAKIVTLLRFCLLFLRWFHVFSWLPISPRKQYTQLPHQKLQLYIGEQATVAEDEHPAESYQEQDDRNADIAEAVIEYYSNPNLDEINGHEPPNNNWSDGTGTSSRPKYNGRANLQLPPGWGKTQLALSLLANMTQTLQLRSAIYVTPRLTLVDQVLEHLDRFGALQKVPHDCLIVASQTCRNDIQCTTSVDAIASFLSLAEDQGRLPLLISTYQSLPKVGEALRLTGNSIDFCIFDEAHEMEGAGDKRSGYGLYDSLLPASRRLFFTATPRHYTENPKQKRVLGTRLVQDGSLVIIPSQVSQPEPNIASFANESLFGPCLARKTFRESTEQNITVPITLWALDRQEIFSILGKSIDISLESKDYLLAFAVQAAFETLNVSHAVSFHSMNYRALAFAETAAQAFGEEISVFNVNGTRDFTAKRRDEVLASAASAERSLVTNCRMLSTGVDVAKWEMVVVADPVRSQVLARQMIGRVSRKAPNKKRGYVLVPLLLEDDSELMLANSVGYQVIVSTFEAMVGLDPLLRQDVLFVIEKSQQLGRPLERTEFPVRLRDSFRLPAGLPTLAKTKLMNRAIMEYKNMVSWDDMYSLLLAYRDREGHCMVPQRHEEGGLKLGQWLANQRAFKKTGRLPINQKERLENAGMIWNLGARRWDTMFDLLLKFKQREGHCVVPYGHQEDGLKLGVWINNQKTFCKEGKMDADCRKRLDEAGMVWNATAYRYELMFGLLEKFKEREGHCRVLRLHQEDGENLGKWLANLRVARKNGKLDKDQEKRLEDIGVSWSIFN